MDEVRDAEVAEVAAGVVGWALDQPGFHAVGMAGSWARGAARADSDVDLVVLVDDPASMRGGEWAAAALPSGARDVGTREWGPLLERRFRLPSGLEVELGFAPPYWAAVPPDPGTSRVVSDGFVVLLDPAGLLLRLVRAVARES